MFNVGRWYRSRQYCRACSDVYMRLWGCTSGRQFAEFVTPFGNIKSFPDTVAGAKLGQLMTQKA